MENSLVVRPRRRIPAACVGIVFLILLSVIVLQAFVIGFGFGRRNELQDKEEIECRTPECLFLAKQLRSSMNFEVDPCDNFYEYACGRVNTDTKVDPPTIYKVAQILKDTNFTLRSRAERLARQFYLNCLDRDEVDKRGLEPFWEYLKGMGGWGRYFNVSGWSLQSTLTTAHLYKQNLLFTWDVTDDTRDSSKRIIALERECVNMTKPLHLTSAEGDDTLELLLENLKGLERLMPIDIDAGAIVELERLLESIPKPPFDPEIENALTRLSISKLQIELPFLNWLEFFARSFSEVNITLTPDSEVLVEDMDYFKHLSKVITFYMGTERGRTTLANYLAFQMLFDFSLVALPIHGEEVEEDAFEAICLDATKEVLPFAVSAIYVREFVDKGSIAQVQTLADAIRYKFEETIASTKWMDAKSLEAALEKVKRIRMVLGYQKYIFESEKVDSIYTDLSFRRRGFFERALEGRLFRRKSSCKYLTASPHPDDLDALGDDVSAVEYNAFYLMSRNTVVVPAAYMQIPRYNMFYPRYAQFGIMGFTIGHELFHALDNTGRQFDQRGNLRKWWDNTTVQRFENRTQCFIDQFAAYETHGMQLNGNETLGENVADVGGLTVAFKAYRSWLRSGIDHPRLPRLELNHEQLFFLSFAQDFCAKYEVNELRNLIFNDEHTPNEFRIIGTLRNMPEFAEVFGCSDLAAMNPPDKCELW